jgi:hypothetical protein
MHSRTAGLCLLLLAAACDGDGGGASGEGAGDASVAPMDGGDGGRGTPAEDPVCALFDSDVVERLEDTGGEVLATGRPYLLELESGFSRLALDANGAAEVTLFYPGNAVTAVFCPGSTEECLSPCEEVVATCDGQEIRSRGGARDGDQLELASASGPVHLVAVVADRAPGACGGFTRAPAAERDCADPTPLMLADNARDDNLSVQRASGQDSGLELCGDGAIHRREALACNEELRGTFDPTGPEEYNRHLASDEDGGVPDVLVPECVTDDDCGEGRACLCAALPSGSGPGVRWTYCVDAECHSDADCGDYRCGLSRGPCQQTRLRCFGPDDACRVESDCRGADATCAAGEMGYQCITPDGDCG